jgi:hypothetical protein
MKVVAIHGIAQTYRSSATLESNLLLALQGGLDEAGCRRLDVTEFASAFYGAVFRPPGTRAAGIPLLAPNDLDDWERELLVEWWKAAAALSASSRAIGGADPQGESPEIQGPDFSGRACTPALIQRALRQLCKSRFVAGLGPEKFLIFALRQVRLFLHDAAIKRLILARVAEKVTPATRVIIGHSMGSVVAYEALCAHPEWRVDTFVTLGSPLGTRGLIFDALTPLPINGHGVWPNVRQWTNIADSGDIVALEKRLAPLFGSVVDVAVTNGWQSHAVERYLSARETGRAVAQGLGQ